MAAFRARREAICRQMARSRAEVARPLSERDPAAVREMFDRIARRYDLANTVLSLGGDVRWRRRAARAARLSPGGRALDVACGSGKLAAELARTAQGVTVAGLDFSPRMLEQARAAHPQIEFTEGDALDLPFPDARFDAATIAFGLRNLADPERGLKEMRRVVKPGGRMVVLEFVRPPAGLTGAAYRLYLKRLLPVLGGALSGDGRAYRYLSDTVDAYRTPDQLQTLARSAGWVRIEFSTLNLGTVGLLAGSPALS
jgi:demethylmenaquinone methyltransferase / 2-methoxy-6-polyprenyl-1,4-benzoquinol methylase